MLVSCAEPSSPTHTDAPVLQTLKVSDAGVASVDAGDALDAAVADASTPHAIGEPKIGRAEAIDILFTAMHDTTTPACEGSDDDAIRCLIDARYASDAKAHELARGVYALSGTIFGVEREHMMDGGYRGMIHVAPVLPGNDTFFQAKGVALALVDLDDFFTGLKFRGNADVSYRWRSLAIRFFRSVHARTPSAYASGWTVAFNVDGSLNKTDVSIRETMFHEIFHLNDFDHGKRGDDWSAKNLGATYAAIIAKCKNGTPCLSKYAPNDTMVRGGTYYAFQPGNDVREYAAELAVRYYREQRGMLGSEKPVKISFKCTGNENAESWSKLKDEFFGGIDLTPRCP